MRSSWKTRLPKILLFVVIAVSAITFITMSLWNWLMPSLFGLRTLRFGQTLGLLALSKILFSGFRRPGGGRGGHWRGRMMEKWEQMSPEEREKFRDGMRGRCGNGEREATT